MKHVARFAFSLFALSALLIPFAVTAADDADVLADFRARWIVALKEGDAAKFASLFAENGTIMPPGFPSFTGRKAIENFYRDGFAVLSVRDVELQPKERHTGTDSVRERGTYKVTFLPKNDELPYTITGRYLFILAKRPDGTWELVWEMHTIENKVPLDQL